MVSADSEVHSFRELWRVENNLLYFSPNAEFPSNVRKTTANRDLQIILVAIYLPQLAHFRAVRGEVIT